MILFCLYFRNGGYYMLIVMFNNVTFDRAHLQFSITGAFSSCLQQALVASHEARVQHCPGVLHEVLRQLARIRDTVSIAAVHVE